MAKLYYRQFGASSRIDRSQRGYVGGCRSRISLPLNPGYACRRHADFGVTPIDFALTDLQQSVRAAIEKICAGFGDDYWLARDRDGKFPDEFYRALAGDGWLGVCIPEAYGGSGPRHSHAPGVAGDSPGAW